MDLIFSATTRFVLLADLSFRPPRTLSQISYLSSSMASSVGTAFTLSAVPRRSVQALNVFSSPNSVSLSSQSKFPSLSLHPSPKRSVVSFAAKPETVDKVCEIVKKQLALAPETCVVGESKFSELGADSLDTVEIVMGLEEAFGICVEEQNAQTILTVHDAAEMIDKLVDEKA